MHADGRSERQTRMIKFIDFFFRNFANAPENELHTTQKTTMTIVQLKYGDIYKYI